MEVAERIPDDNKAGAPVLDKVSELLDRSVAKKTNSDQEIEDDVATLIRITQELKESFHSDSRFMVLQCSLVGAIAFIVWVFFKVKSASKKHSY